MTTTLHIMQWTSKPHTISNVVIDNPYYAGNEFYKALDTNAKDKVSNKEMWV